jgi:beta-glucosidase-like glycosyl hydrolase
MQGAADYVGGFLRNHGYDASASSTVRAVLGAGVDTDCGGGTTPLWSNDTLLELMTNSSTQDTIEPLIDESLKRLFAVRMRLGHFDAPSLQPWGKYGLEHVDTPAHREVAMEAALQVRKYGRGRGRITDFFLHTA